VIPALAAPERRAAPRGGEFVAAGHQRISGAAAAGRTAACGLRFAVGVRLHAVFLSPDRATGTLTRSVGRCAIASAQWTARRAATG
jgi:hypothetical protein